MLTIEIDLRWSAGAYRNGPLRVLMPVITKLYFGIIEIENHGQAKYIHIFTKLKNRTK